MECESHGERDKIIKNYLKVTLKNLFLSILLLIIPTLAGAQKLPFKVLAVVSTVSSIEGTGFVRDPEFKALILTERGGQHEEFVVAALDWLNKFSLEKNFEITVINHASEIDEKLLSKYKVFIQLNYPPYNWGEKSMAAFVKYIEEGRGGWVGFHHASLLGEFDGYPMWNWFSDFMGGIRFKNYIAATASGTVNIEDKNHPVMKGVPISFVIPDDEWYAFDKNPRPNVHVLASVDESSYKPASDIKMGDHPVIWVNDKMKARNIYFLMGHSPSLLKSDEFRNMVGNAIIWAAGK
jgi:uncharacterized protein